MIEAVAIVFTVDSTDYTLATVADHFASPPILEGSQDVFEAEGILSADAFFRPLGGALVRIAFEVDSAADDRAEALAELIADPAFDGTGSLRIELPDGDQLTFSPAAMIRPKVALPSTGDARTRKRWEFVAAPPSIVTP